MVDWEIQMIKHEFSCDGSGCKEKVKALYNGEHYLPPIGWVQLYDENQAQCLDYHLCPDCRPKIRPTAKISIDRLAKEWKEVVAK